MKEQFDIYTKTASNSLFFVVSNYPHVNEICVYGFETKEIALDNKFKYDIGVWQPKGTKQQSNK